MRAMLLLLFLSGSLSADDKENTPVKVERSSIIPRPRIETYRKAALPFAEKEKPPTVALLNLAQPAANEGLDILAKRLGISTMAIVEKAEEASIVIEKVGPDAFRKELKERGVAEEIETARLAQSYTLTTEGADGKSAGVSIRACGEMGIFSALISLCQLVEMTDGGSASLPIVTIADWPETTFRIAKTSASEYSLPSLTTQRQWIALFKFNQFGLQYHGHNAKSPGAFTENVNAVIKLNRASGALETIVYFCPFRGDRNVGGAGAYNLENRKDREEYIAYLLQFLKQGAQGIEIDYNDWSMTKPPIEEVINLVHRSIREKYPSACILYCPPMTGKSQYRGPATPEMKRILSKIPEDVRTLWTGPATDQPVIADSLTPREIEDWTTIAGRKPFLWVNQAWAAGIFATPIPEYPGYSAFSGGSLPKDLRKYFEGVHLNIALSLGEVEKGMYRNMRVFKGVPANITPEGLAYLATAADFLWNPHEWEAVESCRRSKRFVEIFAPLLSSNIPDRKEKGK